MIGCIGHRGDLDANDNPLDKSGNLFMPGERLCKARDCVNPLHILTEDGKERIIQRAKAPRTNYEAADDVSIAELSEIAFTNAKSRFMHNICQASTCSNPIHGRGLCAKHYQVWWRRAEGFTREHFRYYTADVINELAELSKKKSAQCQFQQCYKKVFVHNLCSTHSRALYRFGIKGKATA